METFRNFMNIGLVFLGTAYVVLGFWLHPIPRDRDLRGIYALVVAILMFTLAKL